MAGIPPGPCQRLKIFDERRNGTYNTRRGGIKVYYAGLAVTQL
jgi:hypothetical protein